MKTIIARIKAFFARLFGKKTSTPAPSTPSAAGGGHTGVNPPKQVR